MAAEKNLAERLVDLAVYVPVGIATAVIEELPALAEKGRVKLSGQLQVARMIGKMAVSEAERRVRPTKASPGPSGGPTAPPRPAASAPAASSAPARRQPAPSRPAPSPSPPAAPAPPLSAVQLPIPGYDTLAASQVVQRLGSLRPDELDAVRRYEVANRGRRTILHRIAQLSSSEGRASA